MKVDNIQTSVHVNHNITIEDDKNFWHIKVILENGKLYHVGEQSITGKFQMLQSSAKKSIYNFAVEHVTKGADEIATHLHTQACQSGIGKNNLSKCLMAVPLDMLSDYLRTMSKVAEKSGHEGFFLPQDFIE